MRTAPIRSRLEQYERMLNKAAWECQGRFFCDPKDRLPEARQEAGLIFAKVDKWHKDDGGAKFGTLLYKNLKHIHSNAHDRERERAKHTENYIQEPICYDTARAVEFRDLLRSLSYPAQRMSAIVIRGEADTKSGVVSRMRKLGYGWPVIREARKEIEQILKRR